MTPEARRQMMDAAINGVAKQLAKPAMTDEKSQCLARAKQVSQEVCKTFLARLKLMPMRPDKEAAFDMIAELYRDALRGWPKDDLLYIACLAHASMAVDQLSDELV